MISRLPPLFQLPPHVLVRPLWLQPQGVPAEVDALRFAVAVAGPRLVFLKNKLINYKKYLTFCMRQIAVWGKQKIYRACFAACAGNIAKVSLVTY